MSDEAPPPEATIHPVDRTHPGLQSPVRVVFDTSPNVEVVPGDDSDVEPPDSRDDPAYVAMWSDPDFRQQVYGHRITPEEEERRERINVSDQFLTCPCEA
jgi:hypothetical protein